jgi:cytochrome c peroxidase
MPESAHGAFRTAALRGVEFTEPYMHAGHLPTLEAVVDFYDAGGGTAAPGTSKDPRLAPLGLSAQDKTDLWLSCVRSRADRSPSDCSATADHELRRATSPRR